MVAMHGCRCGGVDSHPLRSGGGAATIITIGYLLLRGRCADKLTTGAVSLQRDSAR